MPQITRQKPSGREVRNNGVQSGSLLDSAIDVSELEHAPLKVLMYGQNRTGKTTLACQGQKPILLISFEPSPTGGAESVRKIQGVHYLKVESTEATGRLAKELIGRISKFKTLVLDSVTSLQDIVLKEILDLPELPDQLGWGTVSGDQYRERSEKTRELLRLYLDLPIDTFFLAKEKDHNPPKEEKINPRTGKVQPDMRPSFLRGIKDKSFVSCDLGGATAGWLQDACDCICRLYLGEEITVKEMPIGGGKKAKTETHTGKFIRYLRTSYHPNYAAGIRSCDPKNVPEEIEAHSPEEMYQKLLKVIRG